MTEYQYLEALDKALMELSQAEREEVLDDYRQHFRDGRANGKTDEEIAEQLGDPGLAARQYLADRQDYFHYPYAPKKPRKKSWWRWVAGGAALLAAIGIGLAVTMPRYNYASDDVWIDTATFSSVGVAEEAVSGSGYQVLFEDMFSNMGEMTTEIVDAAMGAVTVNTTDEIKDIDFIDNYEDVDKISMEVSYRVSCHLIPTDSPVVSVFIQGQIPTQHDIDVSLSGGKLKVKYEHNGLYADAETATPAHVMIYVPMGWEGEAQLVTIAGDIILEDGCSLDRLSAVTASGSLYLRQTGCTMEKLEAVTASGNVSLAVDAVRAQVAGVSGWIDADLSVEKGEIATVSGTVDVTLRWVDSSLEVATVSGDVSIAMPENYGYEYNTVSGSVANLSVFGHGPHVEINTVSGNITLLPLPQQA